MSLPQLLPILIPVAIFIGIVAVIYLFMGRGSGASERAARLADKRAGGPVSMSADRDVSPSMSDRMPWLTRLLSGTSFQDEAQIELLRAGLLLRPSELILLALLAMAGGGIVGFILLRSPAGALVTAPVGAVLPWVWIKLRQGSRQRSMMNQLPDAMDMLATALRTGFSFLRGLQLIASQMQPPISEEFRRVAAEVQMGMGTSDALDGLIDRTRSYDLELVVAAVQIHLNVGGNLSEILDSISGTIRERIKLQGEINAATAESRMSGGVLMSMPFFVGLAIHSISPHYMDPLFTTSFGLVIAVIAGIMLVLGVLVMKRLMVIDV
jgi:tight adherence protein B